MDIQEYINLAEAEGYELRRTGIGMGYITIGSLQLTEVMDSADALMEMVMIGMAISQDLLRQYMGNHKDLLGA